MQSSEKCAPHLKTLLHTAVERGDIPGAVATVGRGRDVRHVAVAGKALVHGGAPRPMTEDTIFDMASLTKVMVTLPLILILAEEGRLTLADRVQDYLPEFQGPQKDPVTLSHLLTHSGGLVAHREYFKNYFGYSAVLEAAIREPLSCTPATRVIYSDLGFMMLGEIIRRASGMSLTDAADRWIFSRLGMADSGYRPSKDLAHRIAATEVIDGQAKVGVVHDDNTEAMGGESGHAGLFATAADVGRYVSEWAAPSGALLSPAAMMMSVMPKTDHMGGNRGLGWVLRGDAHDVLGDFWPYTSASHTGYTGTSIAFDPHSHDWAVLLTNRVHFGRQKDIAQLRRRFHNVAIAGLS